MYILFPSITMLLGWGLRGYIGGGPFGAMIPGAMIAMSLAMLLKLTAEATSVLVVFAAVGIGLGGEMTYGQTLGFLRNPETMWWGILGTTVKGSIWGLLGGIILCIGLIYHRLPGKTVIIAFLLLLTGMLIGFKLINQPMIIYFSDPGKPRPESWGALLVGAIALLIFLKYKTETAGYKIITRFALLGLIGGGLGFGLGGLWMVLGFNLPKEVIFQNWWKAMEFSFGFLLGGALGIAAWLSRKEIESQRAGLYSEPFSHSGSVWKEFSVTLFLAILIFWAMPSFLDPIVDADSKNQGSFVMINFADLAKILSNFAFYGFIMVLAVMRFPSATWQIGITITFCYAAIDLMEDVFPEVSTDNSFTLYLSLISLMILIVGVLTAWFQRNVNIIRNMFLLLVWSCMVVAFLRLGLVEKSAGDSIQSWCEYICGKYFVHIVFTLSALYITWISITKFRLSNN